MEELRRRISKYECIILNQFGIGKEMDAVSRSEELVNLVMGWTQEICIAIMGGEDLASMWRRGVLTFQKHRPNLNIGQSYLDRSNG
jgi:hypothetical protein